MPTPLTSEKKTQLCNDLATALEDPTRQLTDEELIALAERQNRVDAGLRVVVSATAALVALYDVLWDPDMKDKILSKLPEGFKNALTNAVQKLKPLFEGIQALDNDGMKGRIDNLLDAGVDLSYAVCELDGSGETSTADSVAVVAGIVQRGLPYLVLSVELIDCCMQTLAHPEAGKKLTDESFCQSLRDALNKKADDRKRLYDNRVTAGRNLIKGRQMKALAAVAA